MGERTEAVLGVDGLAERASAPTPARSGSATRSSVAISAGASGYRMALRDCAATVLRRWVAQFAQLHSLTRCRNTRQRTIMTDVAGGPSHFVCDTPYPEYRVQASGGND